LDKPLSVTEIIEEFQLNHSEEDLEAIAETLKNEIVKIHPNRDAGEFKSKGDEEKYHKLNDANIFILQKIKDRSALIPMDQLSDLIVKTISTTIEKKNQKTLQEEKKDFLEETKEFTKRKYATPKISSGTFAAISGFLFLNPEVLIEHPIFKPFFEDQFFSEQAGFLVLFYLFMISSFGFLSCWWMERRIEGRIKYLLSDIGFQDFFKDFLELLNRKAENKRRKDGENPKFVDFFISDLYDFIRRHLKSDQNSIEKIAALYIKMLLQKNIIEEIKKPSINRVFKIDLELYFELRKTFY